MRRFSQRSHLVTLSEINITPLLDLAFVLLIIFIITTPLVTAENGLNLKLPVGHNPTDRPPDPKNRRFVDIDPNGRYAMDKNFMPLNRLVASLAQQFQANPNLVIYIRADENSRMKDFVALTDACTIKGISRYSIRTQPPGQVSRLQKKCFIGATGFHLLLLTLLIVAPAFLSPGESDPTPVLEFIPTIITESPNQGGGTPLPPTPTPTPPAALQAPTQPEVQKPTPQPPPQRDPDPPKVERVTPTKPDPDSVEPKQDKKVHKVQISEKVINPRERKPPTKPVTDPAATAAAAAAAKARADAERKQQFASALKSISSGLTSSTKIEIHDGPNGPGGGGVSYANYGQEVRRIYTEAWHIPEDVTDDEATVIVRVTIARAGNVISSSIVQSSGSKLVDRSIQATLDRVTFVRPFPEGSKDLQNTFRMTFNLKAKKLG